MDPYRPSHSVQLLGRMEALNAKMRHILLAALCILLNAALSAQASYVLNSHILSAHIQADVSPGFCNEANGEIIINAIASGNLSFSMDGELFQHENVFTRLQTGAYTIYIRNTNLQTDSLAVEISNIEPIHITDISTSPSKCGEKTGKILIETSGGKQPVSYILNYGYPQQAEYFDELNAGTYHLRAIDANGCVTDTLLTITQTGCPIYIPNIFSPNGDGINDFFQIQTADENNVLITRFLIFDRWGSKVYEKYDLPIHSSDGWWDGTYKRFTMNKGYFAYFVEVQFENGDKETFRGNVTLIK